MDQIENLSIQTLAAQYGTPLYVYSETQIRQNVEKVLSAFRNRYPDFELHYAVKANSNLELLKLIHSMGVEADVAAPGEIAYARRAGFLPQEILYTGNYESDSDLKEALDQGVNLNLDSVSALRAVLKIKVPEQISFRINPGVGKGPFAQIVTGGEESKFGIPFEKALEAYQEAQKAGVKRFGIHMHVGSNLLEPKEFGEIVVKLMGIAGPLFKALGKSPVFVDIGGGLGIPYTNKEKPLNLERTAAAVVSAFQAAIKKYEWKAPRLILEPGRYLVGNAGWLISQVTRLKKSYRTFVGVDAGMQTLIRPALYGATHRVSVVGKTKPLSTVNLCGPICESTDVFFKNLKMPEVSEGDLVVIHDAGAYGYSMASSYNGRPRPAEVLVKDSAHRLIRKRETYEDLMG